MNAAALNISKVLTVVGDRFAYNTKLGNLAEEAAKFDEVALRGTTSMAKYAKYVSIMQEAGYAVIETEYVRENQPVKGAVEFRLRMVK